MIKITYSKELFEYISNGDITKIKLFIENFKKTQKGDINLKVRGRFNYTPLHYAVLRNNYELVKMLIEENINPNELILQTTRPPNGISALYLSENFGKDNITKILKPYTQEYNLLNQFYTFKSHKKMEKNHEKYYKILLELVNILNKLELRYLPQEIWDYILTFCKIKELIKLN